MRFQSGEVTKYKSRLCTYDEMQHWGVDLLGDLCTGDEFDDGILLIASIEAHIRIGGRTFVVAVGVVIIYSLQVAWNPVSLRRKLFHVDRKRIPQNVLDHSRRQHYCRRS